MLNSMRYFMGISLFIGLISLTSPSAKSAPYVNRTMDFQQPDGTTISLILNGDEYYMRAETLDGATVVRDPKTNWICYATLSEDGSSLVSTGVPVEVTPDMTKSTGEYKTVTPGLNIKKGLQIKDQAKLKVMNKNKQRLFDGQTVIDGLIQPKESTTATSSDDIIIQTKSNDTITMAAPSSAMPGTANINNFNTTIKGLVIIVDFDDAPAQHSMQQYTDKVTKSNFHYSNGTAASLKTYYEDVSRGVFVLDHYVYGIFRAPKTFAYYDSLNYAQGAQELLGVVLRQMDAEGFDFSQISHDSNGEIKALCIMYTGSPPNWAEGMWWHAGWWNGFSADGVHTGSYCTDTANDLSPGTLIHEHGHMAAKWPDTYSYVGGEPGTWGVMGGGYCDLPNPYFLYRNGWLDGENIFGSGGIRYMDSADPHFAYFYYDTAQPTEFFIMKPYVKSLLFCPNIPEEGLSIWRVNTQGDNANYPDKDRYVELVHANNNDNQKNYNVLFKSGGLLDHFTSDTTPSSDWKFGTMATLPSDMELTGISPAGATMSFTVGGPIEPTAHYAFNANFADTSGNGYTATGYNFPGSGQWITDVSDATYYDLDRSITFDGSDDYVILPKEVGASDKMTVTCWVKPQAAADMVVVDKFPADASGQGWSIRLRSDNKVEFLIGSQNNYSRLITVNPVYEAGRWFNIACSYADGTANIFINGKLRILKNNITQSVNNTVNYPQLGIAEAVNTEMIFNGKLDDLRFYDSDLSDKTLKYIDGTNFIPAKSEMFHLRLDDESGITANDTSGHERDGTLYNGLTFDDNSIAGPVAKALSFDGEDDYISLPANNVRELNDGISIALWVNPTAVQSWARFTDFGNGDASDNIVFTRYSNTNRVSVEVFNGGSSGGRVLTDSILELNQWQFYTATITRDGFATIYKDGVLVASGNTAAVKEIFRKNLYIARSNWGSDDYFMGGMDDVRVYNYSLSEDEVIAIYNNSRHDGPVPFNGADNISPEVVLDFEPANNALRHDIYFGTKYQKVLNANTSSAEYAGRKIITRFNPPNLRAWQEYFWRVDEVMPDGTVLTGSVWSFSTSGDIVREVWTDIGTANELTSFTQNENYPDNPSLTSSLSTFEIPSDFANGYGSRVHGLLTPSESGMYQFWISGDNEVELWISMNANPQQANREAYIHGTWSGNRDFDSMSSQETQLLHLIGGEQYYIMALHKEGDGGDHMAVAWQGPDSPERSIIDSFWIAPPKSNEWPAFAVSGNPLVVDALEGEALNTQFTALASDPDYDMLRYFRYAGPSWLSISDMRTLFGKPTDSDVGLNTFIIGVDDGHGGFDYVPLSVNVADKYYGEQGLSDLEGMAGEWLSGDSASGGNLNEDNIVDMADFGAMAENWEKVSPDGLVAHWKLDDCDGTIARDTAGNSDGILTNMGMNWTSGVYGNALAFDGVDDYVEMPGFTGVSGQESRTCSAWIKTTTNNRHILTWGTTEIGSKWTIRLNGDGMLRVEVSGGYISGSTMLTDGQWHNIAVVLDSDSDPDISEVQLYIDGQAEITGGYAGCPINTSATENVKIGVHYQGLQYFDGLIDDVRIYNTALSSEYISTIIHDDSVCHYYFDQSRSSTAYSYVNTSFNAILKNNAGWQYDLNNNNGWLTFDGVDDFVELEGFKGITGGGSRSCVMRVKIDIDTRQILSWGSAELGAKWVIRTNGDGTLRAEVGGGFISGTTNIIDNNWHYIAVVLEDDGSPSIDEALLYVDGNLEPISSSAAYEVNTSDSVNVKIGVSDIGLKYFKGSIDEAAIYDRALSGAEIEVLCR